MTDAQVIEGCRLASDLRVATVCVKPCHVSLAAEELKNSPVGVGTVVGFPHGANETEIKVAEAELAISRGASEIDMVINIGKTLSGEWDYVQRDIELVTRAVHRQKALVKVIFETDLVTDSGDKVRLCKICEAVGADFVKTSTGFGFVKGPDGTHGYIGATEADVWLMRESCDSNVKIKASGGIRNFAEAKRFVDLGCARLGTSASIAIAQGGADNSSY